MDKKITFTDSILYHGNINISIVNSKGKVISTKSFHNAGTKQLAKFLCYCLAGNYGASDKLRPFKIGLFNNNAGTPIESESGQLKPQVPIYISINKVANVSSIVDQSINDISNYKTTLHFLIPYSYITGTDKINQICLYNKETAMPTGVNPDYKNYCASFLLTREDTPGSLSWDYIDPSIGGTSYNLILDWELTFEFKSDFTNN